MSYQPPNHPPPAYQAAASNHQYHEKRHDSYNDDSYDKSPPISAAQQAEEAEREAAFVEESLRSIPKPLHQTSSYPQLPRVIAIPQIGIGSMLRPLNVFTRAYAPDLANFDISKTDFMKMIDTINVCLSDAPPFQVLQLASMGIGFVPHHWATGVSAGLGLVAGAGTAATAYVRTKKCLEGMRDQVWKPRGLRCQMVKDTELLQGLGISEEQAWGMMPRRGTDEPVDLAKSRLQALSPYIASLDFDVPPPAEQTNVLNKLSAKQQARKATKHDKESVKKAAKREKELHKTAAKYDRTPAELQALDATWDGNKSDIDSDIESILSLEDEMEKLDVKHEKAVRKANAKAVGASDKKMKDIEKKRNEREKEYQKERRKLAKSLEKRTGKGNKRERKQDKRENKEVKKVGTLKWIVIRNWDWEAEDNASSSSSSAA